MKFGIEANLASDFKSLSSVEVIKFGENQLNDF